MGAGAVVEWPYIYNWGHGGGVAQWNVLGVTTIVRTGIYAADLI